MRGAFIAAGVRWLAFGALTSHASVEPAPIGDVWLLWLAGALATLATLTLAAWLVARALVARGGARFVAPINRFIVAVLWIAPLGALYLGVGLAITRIKMSHAPPLLALATLALAALTAVIYMPLRAGIQRFISTTLYHDYYRLDMTLQRYSQGLATLHTQPEIADYLLDQLTTTLNLSGVAFVALPDGLERSLLGVIESDDLRARRDCATPAGRAAILTGLRALDVEHLRAHVTTPRWEPFVAHPWLGCAALTLIGLGPADTAVQALLIVGPKRAHNPLRRQDRALLRTLASQAAVALTNAQLLDGLRISLQQTQVASAQLATARAEQQLMLRELVGADDRQRAALARELHDDALQDALYVTRHTRVCARLAEEVEALMQSVMQSPIPSAETAEITAPATLQSGAASDLAPGAQATPTAADDTLAASTPPGQARIIAAAHALRRLRSEGSYVTERSQMVERKLRALCLGLHPEALNSLGLIAALDELGERIQEETAGALAVSTYFDAQATAIAEHLAPQAALSLYRIAQEALRNAAKHGDATAVALRLTADVRPDDDVHSRSSGDGDGAPSARQPRMLTLEARDDGNGMPLPVDFGRLLREGHLGLAGMRERAETLGARLRFQRAPGGGAALTLSLPLTPRIMQPPMRQEHVVRQHTNRAT